MTAKRRPRFPREKGAGALPPAALLEAALTALGQPLARPDAYAVALPEEPPEQPAEKLTALLDAATAAYVDAAAAAVPPAAEGASWPSLVRCHLWCSPTGA